MKKLLIVCVAIVVCAWLASDMWARGGRGGGGGGGRSSGGGASRGGGARPSGGTSRSSGGDLAMSLLARPQCRGRVRQTLKNQVAAKLQIIGRRWVLCPRPAIALARGAEIDLQEATSPIGPAQMLAQALARVLSLGHDQEPAHDHQQAMCKIFLICQMPVAEMSVPADHQAASVTWPQLLVAH